MMDSTNDAAYQRLLPILVVEDNKDQQLLYGYTLRVWLPQVRATFKRSAQEALDYLAATCEERPTHFPCLVLLDLHLPELWQGWQALSEIRSHYPRLPVIVMSNMPRQEIIDKSYDLGAHSFLIKPYSLEEWEGQLTKLGEYWLDTVTLSKDC